MGSSMRTRASDGVISTVKMAFPPFVRTPTAIAPTVQIHENRMSAKEAAGPSRRPAAVDASEKDRVASNQPSRVQPSRYLRRSSSLASGLFLT